MSNPFIGQITLFGGTFAPRGWALCDGQLLPINSFQALFSILGTNFGGDGVTNFALPDLRGRVPMHPGAGPGLTPRSIGQTLGTESVTLQTTQIPAHQHPVNASADIPDTVDPSGNFAAAYPPESNPVYATSTNGGTLTFNSGMIPPSGGGGQSHNNIQPVQCINYIIALVGIYPSRP